MDKRKFIGLGLIGFFVVFFAQYCAIWMATSKTNNVSRFSLSSDRIAKDLEGRVVTLMLNQVWPFDQSQNISIQVLGKKQIEEYVMVVVEVKASAAVQQIESPKEQFSTSTTTKEVPKTPVKLPSKLQLVGRMKLTYEIVDDEWYLLATENLTLRAVPFD